MNKWYKNKDNKVLAGVLSGFLDYTGWKIDISLVRIIFVILALVPPLFPILIIVYIVAVFILPTKPEDDGVVDAEFRDNNDDDDEL
ncbi:MAG: PspC domain-containing protein [Lactobacillaceae bacterium]|jgi:phage shock protein PspC (stress-responsive transcriptional regulator)|nr:PspC domain-containing protein [Lactobacillaceae bacterium]